jgi:hypothetical protein
VAEHRETPKRIQRKRTKGWKMPDNAVYVGRPTQWGNPWREGVTTWTLRPDRTIDRSGKVLTREDAVESYRNCVATDPVEVAHIREHLAGKDLACWCRLDQACHADVLLEIANGGLDV